jgi:hypothetical protein
MAMQLPTAAGDARSEPPTWTALVLEMVALHHQIAVLKRSGTRRPCFHFHDRLFWLLLARWWPGWRDSLGIVQPATVLRWRRLGWSRLWRYRPRGSLARWTPQNFQRDSPAHRPHGTREFPLGSATDSWRAADARGHRFTGHRIAIYAAGQPAAGTVVADFPSQSSHGVRSTRACRGAVEGGRWRAN